MKYRTILLFGAPGSGKGTQGKILGSIPNLFHFACGDAFRNLRIDDPLGRVFVEYSSKGRLVPDEPTIKLWAKNIQASTLDGQFNPETDMLVLDGIPRSVKQAEMLKDTLDVKAVFNLTCADPAKMIERLQRRALRENRLDDANLRTSRSSKSASKLMNGRPNRCSSFTARGSSTRLIPPSRRSPWCATSWRSSPAPD